MDDFLAPPPFKPEAALIDLRRRLRDLRPLAERGTAFELRGQPVVTLGLTDTHIEARLAKRPAVSPEWTLHMLRSSADARKFVDTVRLQIVRWTDE
jgi:hypothetical protein